MVEIMSTEFIVIALVCVLVCLIGWANPKFDRVTTTTAEGTSDKLLMWYTPFGNPTTRKYIVVKDYGRVKS